jgi:Protein of unknown function (DUF1553)/Protein of unknown function (DUF1549)/Planctomycete cytochrome C
MGKEMMMNWNTIGRAVASVVMVLAGTSRGQASDATTTEGQEFFEKNIRPVLVNSCYECHSATAKKLKGGLHLDTRKGVIEGGDSGPVLVRGDPDQSLLIKAIRYTDPDLQMPPKKKKLPPEVIENFVAWVKMGAPDPRGEPAQAAGAKAAREKHWAFQPVKRPPLPKVTRADWVQTPVDAFVLARLEQRGLAPSPRADRRTLIRRATYDLTGLPPTSEEVAAFEADSSSDAFARLVDRLLESPHYGERWARYWLDIARYADTKGYLAGDEQRLYPYSYTYRDYVIQAFNEDLPYDRFLIEQLAADKLSLGDDKRPLAALGFLTLGRRFLNNISDIIDDRIDVVCRGTMGLTVACARCHDHKFDPIPSADYYSLYGVFANSHEPAEKPLLGTRPPDKLYQAYLAEKQRRQDELDRFRESKIQEGLEEVRRRSGDYLLTAWEARKLDGRDQLDPLAQKRKLVPGVVRRWMQGLDNWRKDSHPNPVLAPWFQLAGLPEGEFAAKAKELTAQWAAHHDPAHPLNPLVVSTLATHPPANLSALAEAYGNLFQLAERRWQETLGAAAKKPAKSKNETSAPPATLSDPNLEAIRQVLYADGAPARVPPDETDQLLGAARPRLRQLKAKVDEVDATHEGAPARAMVLEDNSSISRPHILLRGNPRNPGPEVPLQFLEVVAGTDRVPFRDGSGRLEMARAIASTNNPLTARVFVNRVWMYHFGKPLVHTPSDFGTRAEPPTHPGLLDYLAARFMEEGWSIKKLHRWIMLSSAYQQSSAFRPEPAKADPENDLVWRMNRRRLDFEAMRDTLLAVSGRLDLSQGGRSVDIVEPPFNARRTVYGFVERQNLPGLFRTFDFASPDATSPHRFATTVPQQALFLMNSPFVIEQAGFFLKRDRIQDAVSEEDKIRRIFQVAYQRNPDPEEMRLARDFLEGRRPHPEPSEPGRPWQYGWGEYEDASGQVVHFTPLPYFNDHAWQGGPKLPDPKLGWVLLTADGGHPGDAHHAAVRRWTAPREGIVAIGGVLDHPSDQGNGVRGRVISSRHGEAGQWTAQHGQTPTKIERLELRAGDTVDFITESRGDVSFDSFHWAPTIRYLASEKNPATESDCVWNAGADFKGPEAKEDSNPGLTPMQEFAQIILLSNELFFVD